MGFTSVDSFVNEVTTNSRFCRMDFMKNTSGLGTVVAGRWYDLSQYPITGTAVNYAHGNMVKNWDFLSGTGFWTLGSGLWVWTMATNLVTKTAGDAATVSQNTLCVNGVSYSVVFTMTRTAGTLNYSLGGTAGTPHALGGTYRETIVCGATASAPLVFTPDAAFAGSIDVIAVTRDLGFTPYDSNGVLGPGTDLSLGYHGGDVSALTKHIVNMGSVVNVAAGAPSVLLLVDMLGVYPRIRTDINTLQTLNNTLTLPRYTDGKKVRPFFVLNTANGGNASNFVMSYTNTVPAAGQSLGSVVSNTISAIVGHMTHSGVAAGNFGPFLPLAGGDQGVKTVESARFTVASASAGFVDLVLCVPLAYLPITAAFYTAERDFMNQLPSLPRVYDGACLNLLAFSGAVIPICSYQGYVDFAWG